MSAINRSESPLTLWRCPNKYKKLDELHKEIRREKRSIISVGNSIPPLIKSFKRLGVPRDIRKILKKMHIRKPTSLQMQALPAILIGRDTLMMSLTRSGKTLAFCLPLIMGSFEEEHRMNFIEGEGPVGLIVVPSRELAYQIYKFILKIIDEARNYPKIRVILCIGGVDMKHQMEILRQGVHIIISTPGRLSDMLAKHKIFLAHCKAIVLDEADRLLDLGFEDDIRIILSHARPACQIILSSATIPKKIQEFSRQAMKDPIFINLSRQSLSKLKLTQEVEYAGHDQKLLKLLETMQKTNPPILIFCENKIDADKIERFLYEKRIDVACLHGGKEQNERTQAIKDFNRGKLDVLAATDVAAKGLNFYNVRHIINFDLPKEIDSYIQRVCRAGKRAVITTYLSYNLDKLLLCDLKHFLEDSRQNIPIELEGILDGEDEQVTREGNCAYCKLPDHRRSSCPTLQQERLKSLLPI
ncbi:unnamed protein product [Blepharisma stoltei]|uniref:RNA helicase n=1 Tax=Blepharisma stoltei TaxID=1481888 RepID=A0AAU9JK49_9CILI|nr:unnamed protein product [Blepharisma stoltei]